MFPASTTFGADHQFAPCEDLRAGGQACPCARFIRGDIARLQASGLWRSRAPVAGLPFDAPPPCCRVSCFREEEIEALASLAPRGCALKTTIPTCRQPRHTSPKRSDAARLKTAGIRHALDWQRVEHPFAKCRTAGMAHLPVLSRRHRARRNQGCL